MTAMRSLLGSLLFLAACGGKPAAHTIPVDNGGGTTVPAGPPYAALFESGRSWTFEVKYHNSFWDDQDPKADANGNVNDESTGTATCKVTAVEDTDDGKSSHIECDALGSDDVGGEPLSGDWLAAADGLYKVDAESRELVMAAAPVAKQETSKDNPDDPTQETGWLKIEKKGDAWCWDSSAAMGDESWQSLCFGAAGVTEGTFGWAGGSTHEATFTLKETP